MRKGSIINGILVILILVSGLIVGMALFSYVKENWGQETVLQIPIATINSEEKNENTYTIESIEPAGQTTLTQNANGEQSSNFQGTKYYYEQLDDYAKIVYQAFENNIENLKTGTYKLQFSNEFDELLKQENGNDKLNDEFQQAWDAFSYDRPDVFFLDPNKFSITVETTKRALKTSYQVYINSGDNANYLDSGFSSKEQVDQSIDQITELKKQFVEQMQTMSSDYEKVKALHDWIVENIEYDSTMQKEYRYNIYGALIDRSVVCEGYAKLFKYILDDVGIECVLASGTAINSEGSSERHMWNYVKLDGVWYAVDCTWDDPIIIGGGKLTKDIKYKYFLKGSSFYNDHTEEAITEKSQNLSYPKISEQDYK